MEIKINREIRDFTEAVFFGLSLRQFILSIMGIGVSVGLYFLLTPIIPNGDILGWLCVVGAAPFAAIAFVKYQGMPFEQLIFVWVKSRILMPQKLSFTGENVFLLLYRESMAMKPNKNGGHITVPNDKKPVSAE